MAWLEKYTAQNDLIKMMVRHGKTILEKPKISLPTKSGLACISYFPCHWNDKAILDFHGFVHETLQKPWKNVLDLLANMILALGSHFWGVFYREKSWKIRVVPSEHLRPFFPRIGWRESWHRTETAFFEWNPWKKHGTFGFIVPFQWRVESRICMDLYGFGVKSHFLGQYPLVVGKVIISLNNVKPQYSPNFCWLNPAENFKPIHDFRSGATALGPEKVSTPPTVDADGLRRRNAGGGWRRNCRNMICIYIYICL